MPARRIIAVAALACGVLFAPAAHARQVGPEDRNAALQYLAVSYFTDRELFAKMQEVDLTKVGSEPPAFQAARDAIVADNSNAVKQLIEASKLRKCDFEIPWEQGPSTLLPHLGNWRAHARLLRVDARRLALAGDAEASAERLAAMIRISRHATHDPVVISSLVSIAICTLALHETEAQLEAGKLNAAACEIILEAISLLDADDPFAMMTAVRGEQRWTIRWLKETFRGPEAGKKLVATGYVDMGSGMLVAGAAPSTPPPPPAAPPPRTPPPPPPPPPPAAEPPTIDPLVAEISAMNEAQVAAAADNASVFYDHVLAVWDSPDAVERLKDLGAKVQAGEFGPIARVFAPAGARAKMSVQKAETHLAEVKQKLAAVK